MMARMLFCLVMSSSSAYALTGAELLQTDRAFAAGYIWGVVEHLFHVKPDADYAKRQAEITECLMRSKVTSTTFHTVVTTYIQNNPETLQFVAVGVVLQAINEICPTGQ